MQHNGKDLSNYRLERAKEDLKIVQEYLANK